MRNVMAKDVINFVKERIIYHFAIPQTITTDHGFIFLAKEFKKFAGEMGITLIQSSPYYDQANGQTEASNKSLIKLIKCKIDEYPKQWHDRLVEALWAYQMSWCHQMHRLPTSIRLGGCQALGSQHRLSADSVPE